MNEKHVEHDILELAREKLEEMVVTPIRLLKRQHAIKGRIDENIIAIGNYKYNVELRPRITQADIGLLHNIKQDYDNKYLIVARYVAPQVADALKAMGIEFIDSVGNAFIDAAPIFIFVKGGKPEVEHRFKQAKRAFMPTGMKVVYCLLCMPGYERENYRSIAFQADVAIGTVNWVFRDLRELGYLQDRGRHGRKLVKKDELFERWITTYPETLRNKQFLGKYTIGYKKKQLFDADQPDKNIDGWWGAEPAAAIMTQKYLVPKILTLYTLAPLEMFLTQYRLHQDKEGDIELLKPFWRALQPHEHPYMVHPLLVYADLMATGDGRNLEAAKMIFEENIAEYLR